MMAQQLSRQINSRPTTHRASRLKGISDHIHKQTASICRLQIKANRLQQLFDEAPENVPSRIDWIQNQLNSANN